MLYRSVVAHDSKARRLWGRVSKNTNENRFGKEFLASSSDDKVANAVANMGSFDTILFNGSLQFFDDYEHVLGALLRFHRVANQESWKSRHQPC